MDFMRRFPAAATAATFFNDGIFLRVLKGLSPQTLLYECTRLTATQICLPTHITVQNERAKDKNFAIRVLSFCVPKNDDNLGLRETRHHFVMFDILDCNSKC